MIRVFLAHKKSTPPEELKAICDAVRDRLRAKNPEIGPIEVVSGVEDHDKNFLERGSWEAWTSYVVSRADVVTREPYYHIIVIPVSDYEAKMGEVRIGRATAQIVNAANAAKRQVAIFAGDLRAVTGGLTYDSDDWRTGWAIQFAPTPERR